MGNLGGEHITFTQKNDAKMINLLNFIIFVAPYFNTAEEANHLKRQL